MRNLDILSSKDLDFVKQKLRNWLYNIIELIIIMHLEIFLMMNSLLYKTSLQKDLIIQKSGKGNSVVIADRQDYIKQMNKIFSYQKKFTMVNRTTTLLLSTKKNTLTRFSKNLLSLVVWQKKNKKSVKPVGSRPGVVYGSYKAHKTSVENCPQFVGQLPAIAQICRLCTLPSTNLRNSWCQF